MQILAGNGPGVDRDTPGSKEVAAPVVVDHGSSRDPGGIGQDIAERVSRRSNRLFVLEVGKLRLAAPTVTASGADTPEEDLAVAAVLEQDNRSQGLARQIASLVDIHGSKGARVCRIPPYEDRVWKGV